MHTVAVAMGCCVMLWATSAYGARPLQPLNCPLYNLDAQSPKVLAGLYNPADLLSCPPTPQDEDPTIAISGMELGLSDANDEIDALSNATFSFSPSQPYSLLFNVDRQTVGVVPPDSTLAKSGVPYNVFDQAGKNQQAGDQYMTLDTFAFGAAVAGTIAGSGSNNSAVRNNFDEGGTDYGTSPSTSASSTGSGTQGGVGSSAGTAAALAVAGVSPDLYFSVKSGSPSLLTLPDGSGATIYRYVPGSSPQVFASFAQLGLSAADDIDAMIVVNQGDPSLFDSGDLVIFSLTPDSPFATSFPGRTDAPGADVYMYAAMSADPPQLRVTSAMFGLGTPSDNITGLDLLPCSDGLACAQVHGIQSDDVPAVSEWGLASLALVMLVAGTIVLRRRLARPRLA